MKNQLSHIQYIISKWKAGSHTRRYLSADRIAVMKQTPANKFFDLSCYQKDWFACFAQGKNGQIWMVEGIFSALDDGKEFDLYAIKNSPADWMLVECVLKNFEYRKNNTPKPSKRKSKHSSMINYLHRQQYGTRW